MPLPPTPARTSRLTSAVRRPLVLGLALTLTGGTVALTAPTSTAVPVATARQASTTVAPTPAGLDLSTASIADLQRALAEGRTTSVELVRAYLDRIERVDAGGPAINAIRQVSASALDDARAADAARAAGTAAGPLAGIPVIIKDNIDHAGDPTTAGSLALANSFPAADAPVVTAMEEAGAIILAKANLTEFANFMTSGMPGGYSSLGGQVLNPYDLSQSPSGSSAGSGAASAAALAPAAVGTETSGSILSPANANSLVGVKPTVGLISRTGIVPISATQDTAGPMTRYVGDAAAVLTAMTTGADPEDPATQDGTSATYDDVDYTEALSTDALDGVRLGYVESGDETYNGALDVLRAQGATLVPVNAPATTAPSILTFEFKRDLNAYLDRLPDSAPMDSLADVIAFNDANAQVALKFGQSLLTASQDVDLSDPATNTQYETAKQQSLTESRTNIDTTLTANDVDAIVSNARTTAVGARAGYPSVTLPAGYNPANRRSVPITFLGTAYAEESLLGFAYDFEQAASVWKSPQVINPTAFSCTGVSPAFVDGPSCEEVPAAPEPPATRVRSTTLGDLVRNPVKRGQRTVLRVAVASGDVEATGRIKVRLDRRLVATRELTDGRARVLLPRKTRLGRHPVVVRYKGSAEVLPSKDQLVLVVRRR